MHKCFPIVNLVTVTTFYISCDTFIFLFTYHVTTTTTYTVRYRKHQTANKTMPYMHCICAMQLHVCTHLTCNAHSLLERQVASFTTMSCIFKEYHIRTFFTAQSSCRDTNDTCIVFIVQWSLHEMDRRKLMSVHVFTHVHMRGQFLINSVT